MNKNINAWMQLSCSKSFRNFLFHHLVAARFTISLYTSFCMQALTKKNSYTRPKHNRHRGYKVNESDLPGLGPGLSCLRDKCEAGPELLVCFNFQYERRFK